MVVPYIVKYALHRVLYLTSESAPDNSINYSVQEKKNNVKKLRTIDTIFVAKWKFFKNLENYFKKKKKTGGLLLLVSANSANKSR